MGKITGETSHTIKFVPAEKTNEIVLSKRGVARGEKKTRKQQKPKKAKNYVMEEIEMEKKQQTAQVFASKIFENWKISRIFVIFGVNLRPFHLEKCNKQFEKDYWTTSFFLVDTLKHSNPRSLSNFNKKCIKTLKFGNFWFCHFGCQFGTFPLKTGNKLFEKPTGQYIFPC